MPTINLGKIGIVNRGIWSVGTYKKLELAKVGSVTYICDATETTQEPPASDWSVFVSDGADGIGTSFEKPNRDVLFTKTAPAEFTLPIGFKVKVGTTAVELTSVYTLSLNTDLDTGTKTAGTDYYVYAKADSTFYISANKAITTDKLIGGFHYSLTPEAEALSGNKLEADMVKIRGINTYSFWDLQFRPICNPEGMIYVLGKWYDIYLLNSEHITNGTSKAGATIAGGVEDVNARAIPKIPLEFGGNGTTTYGKFTWFQASEIAKSHSKQLISYEEFASISYGVVENVSSSTTGEEVVVGKVEHYPSFLSKFGIEQATGVQYVWGADMGADAAASGWQNQTDGRGQIYGTATSPKAVLLGGIRANGVYSGSRHSGWSNYVWYSSWYVGSRFACDHLNLA